MAPSRSTVGDSAIDSTFGPGERSTVRKAWPPSCDSSTACSVATSSGRAPSAWTLAAHRSCSRSDDNGAPQVRPKSSDRCRPPSSVNTKATPDRDQSEASAISRKACPRTPLRVGRQV